MHTQSSSSLSSCDEDDDDGYSDACSSASEIGARSDVDTNDSDGLIDDENDANEEHDDDEDEEEVEEEEEEDEGMRTDTESIDTRHRHSEADVGRLQMRLGKNDDVDDEPGRPKPYLIPSFCGLEPTVAFRHAAAYSGNETCESSTSQSCDRAGMNGAAVPALPPCRKKMYLKITGICSNAVKSAFRLAGFRRTQGSGTSMNGHELKPHTTTLFTLPKILYMHMSVLHRIMLSSSASCSRAEL